MKLYMEPGPGQAPTDNGIGRIINAMARHLPAFGVQFTADIQSADVVAFHAGTATGKRVEVLHCHGLYWQDIQHSGFSRSNNVANQRIIEAARRAKIITVPSDWVAEPFRRDMRIEPEIVGHGIDVDEWTPGENGSYILWNKNRPTDVCDPSPAWKLAERGLKVVSTFGPTGKIIPNLRVTGQIPFDQMKPIVQNAELYLATTPETFGIGTLEAMISGVPVLGYNWCGTKDLVRHKETGWLVEPGDISGLYEGAAWLKDHRSEIGANARQFAKGFDWKAIMGRYYALYERAAKPEPVGVSIIITNYNYSNWIPDAIRSCLWQQMLPDEIIVVDDGSTDNSKDVLSHYVNDGKPIRVIYQTNQGVAAARNNGIAAARFPFIVCLDADDMIGPEYISTLKPALQRDRGLGVAYPGVKFINENGKDTGFSAFKPFSWEIQAKDEVPPPTCVPSGSMFRKEMWKRNGGYKQKYAPGEDTEFWTHGLSLGFTAEMVTPETLFWYRGHPGSASRTKQYVSIGDNKPWLKDKVYPMGAPAFYVPAVRSYLNPVVSVIIPVGPGHEKLVEDAIESMIGQTVREWELIVIDDCGADFSHLDRFPFIKWASTDLHQGAGKARNVGLQMARGKFILFLDADDWLRPDALDLMLQAAVQTGYYAFCNHVEVHADGRQFNREIMPYDRDVYRDQQVMHSVTALVPTVWAREVGGFDPSLIGWEEYDFYMKLAVKGYCGVLVRQPLFYYRVDTGQRRVISQKNQDKLNAIFKKRYGGVEMPGCCGNGGDAILDAKRALGMIPRETITVAELPNEVRLEFTGPFLAPVVYVVNGRNYYGAKDDIHRFINAPREDVAKLVATGKWQVIMPPEDARIKAIEPEVAAVHNVEPLPVIRRRG